MNRIYEINGNVFDLEKLSIVNPCDDSSTLCYYVDGQLCIANFETSEQSKKARYDLICAWKEYHYEKNIL